MLSPDYLRDSLTLLTVGICLLPASYCSAQKKAPKSAEAQTAPQQVAEEKILAALKKKTSMDFVETTLDEVVEFLKDLTNITIVLDKTELATIGVNDNTPVTHNSNLSLESNLNHMLGNLKLSWTIRDEALVITTLKAANKTLITHVYPLEDLLQRVMKKDDPKGKDVHVKELIGMITQSIQADSWKGAGVTVTISYYHKMLIVSQTHSAHARIRRLLADLSKAIPKK